MVGANATTLCHNNAAGDLKSIKTSIGCHACTFYGAGAEYSLPIQVPCYDSLMIPSPSLWLCRRYLVANIGCCENALPCLPAGMKDGPHSGAVLQVWAPALWAGPHLGR
jgi:hypothetical protein